MTFQEVLKANKRMRRRQPVAITQNGGRRTVIQCCLCGATHTYATGWREPKHSREFRDYHNAELCQRQE